MTRGSLPRIVGPGTLALFVVGVTVATAIFRVPSLVAQQAGSPGVALAIWMIGAGFAFAGALCVAELAVRVPRAGGEIAFLRAAYGPGLAFLYGWTALLIGLPAAVAAVARTFADYGSTFLPLSEPGLRLVTAGLIAIHCVVASISTRLAARVVSAATVGKLAAIGLVVVAGLLLPPDRAPSAAASGTGVGSLGQLIAATVAVIWAYDGITSGGYLAGEARDPDRTMPRGLLLGAALVTGIYLLLNATYARTLGFAGVAASPAVAADAMGAIAGPRGQQLVAGLVMLSAYSCGMAQLLGHPRVIYTMASDGLFFRQFAELSKRNQTPWLAVLLIGLCAGTLALLGGYGFLIRLSVFGLYPLYGVAYLGAIRLRRTQGAPAGFRMPGYPVPALVFASLMAVVLVVSLMEDPEAVLYAGGVMLAGAAAYWLVRRRPAREPAG